MNSLSLFKEISDIECLENVNLGNFTTTKLEIFGNLIQVQSIEALKKVLSTCEANKLKFHIIGLGANQIITKTDKVFLKLKFHFDQKYFEEVRDEYILPASVTLNFLTGHALKFGLKDWEALTGIPATLGG